MAGILKPRTHVYVDAFNLYYGALKGTTCKWLDLKKLCGLLLPQHDIHANKYFTALVSARPHDPNQPQRQQLYIRALRTIPEVEVIYGHYLSHAVLMPLASSTGPTPKMVKVFKTEEKGSDVNLATHLLCDAFANAFDIAVIVSNDSDLLLPVRVAREQLGKKIGILNPHRSPQGTETLHTSFRAESTKRIRLRRNPFLLIHTARGHGYPFRVSRRPQRSLR